jgi:hypothetical protein
MGMTFGIAILSHWLNKGLILEVEAGGSNTRQGFPSGDKFPQELSFPRLAL